ncbi:protein mono-ADP-ribosyltransferase PARP14-like [Mytilus californianus]|uniref:protein mono-ADP-ribosyltransferase PARP14-like n=1 Tax=Mytilus californianus TaxID=6549 RepID=UPI0022452B7F|nr:protein mono-ADP-ribosyltransferase PARP14-like [Mytilus californianus]
MEQSSMDFDHATLKVYQGDICALDVSAIVNCTNGKFVSKSGSVSNVIISYGGDSLSRELKTQAKNMKKDKIAMTTAGRNFASEFIIHLDVEDSSSDLKSKIKLVIEKLEEFDQHSVAFPANELGEIQKVSAAFVDVLQDFSGKTDIDVHIVLNDGNMTQTFVTCLESSMSGDQNPSLLSKFAGWIGIGGKTPVRQKRNIQISNVSLKAIVYIKVFAKTEQSAKSAITALENSLESAFQEKTVDDELIKDLSRTQIEDLQQILGGSGVEISLKKNLGRIKITGLPENITHALQEIYTFLRRTEEMRHAEEHAKFVSEMVQWCYMEVDIDGEKLIDYPSQINLLLEQAVRNNKATAEFHDDKGNKYIVDFNSYEEYLESKPSEAVKVIRRNKLSDASGLALEMPSNWSPMDDKENIKLVLLQQTDQEYLEVHQEFTKTTGSAHKIVKISRIQNRTLYQQYKAKKMSMESLNPQGHQNERTLWHGTAYDALDSINTYGFNRSYCGKNATVYGNGVYFARDAAYSARGTYSPKDHNNQRHMYMCKVLTGEYTQGKQGLIVPPPKGTSHILHDCVVDNPADPAIFVIFHDTQAYPEYLVLFEG